ncbi:MAG: helix-turn-helix domain-containing protein [Pseudomonadota bacterium]
MNATIADRDVALNVRQAPENLTVSDKTEPLNYTIKQTCELLNIGRTKVYDLIAAGELEAIRIGSRRLVRGESARHIASNGTGG